MRSATLTLSALDTAPRKAAEAGTAPRSTARTRLCETAALAASSRWVIPASFRACATREPTLPRSFGIMSTALFNLLYGFQRAKKFGTSLARISEESVASAQLCRPAVSTPSGGLPPKKSSREESMESGQPNDKPTAFRMVCVDVSSLELARHATLAERHVAEVGYIRLNTVRPPADHADPIGFGLGFGADPVFVYESILVGNMPSRVCRMFELRTVYLPGVWAAEDAGLRGSSGETRSFGSDATGTCCRAGYFVSATVTHAVDAVRAGSANAVDGARRVGRRPRRTPARGPAVCRLPARLRVVRSTSVGSPLGEVRVSTTRQR